LTLTSSAFLTRNGAADICSIVHGCACIEVFVDWIRSTK
jgi:hypothetical protein